MAQTESSTYDYRARKIVAVISGTLEPWQSMNVLGHMAVALGANKDSELMGRAVLKDASGIEHAGIARFGFIVKKGSTDAIAAVVREVRKNPDIRIIDFPRDMLDTKHDDELSESITNKQEKVIEYLGALFYGATTEVNQATKEFELWS